MEQKATLDSASEITSQYDAIQLNPKGSCTADGSRGSTAILNACTYNVRTLRTEEALDRLFYDAIQIKWDIIGLCETYRKGEGLSEIRGYWMYETGKTEDNPDAKGLTFLIHSKIKDSVTDFKTHSNRMIKMEVNLLGKDSVTVIDAYASISNAEDEKVEQFYDHMADRYSKYKIIQEILMQKTGTKTKEEGLKSMGTFGVGKRNERRDRLIVVAEEHKLVISKTVIQKPPPPPQKKKILDLGVTRSGNKKLNRFYI